MPCPKGDDMWRESTLRLIQIFIQFNRSFLYFQLSTEPVGKTISILKSVVTTFVMRIFCRFVSQLWLVSQKSPLAHEHFYEARAS